VDNESVENRGLIFRHSQKASILDNHLKRIKRLRRQFEMRREFLGEMLEDHKSGYNDVGAQLDMEQKFINELMQKMAAARKDWSRKIAFAKELRNQLRARASANVEGPASAKAKVKVIAKAKAAPELGSVEKGGMKTRSQASAKPEPAAARQSVPSIPEVPGLDNKAKKAKTIADTKWTGPHVSVPTSPPAPPAHEPEPIVEFIGAPVGKGAKVPTGLWPWPGPGEGMATRQRGRKQAALAMMPQSQ
jgi:hypothetical protein